MNDRTETVSTTRTQVGVCPLCAVPLPPTEGPTASDQHDGVVAFHQCGRCRSLVPSSNRSPAGAPEEVADRAVGLERPDRARALVDRLDAAAAGLAWELAEYLPPPGDAPEVVDLGAGRGGVLHALRGLGYAVRGCEPSAFLCQMARASYLLGPGTLDNTSADTHLDAIERDGVEPSAFVLWHVLDRHPSPEALLRRCVTLAPGGIAFIEFPVADPGDLLVEQRFWATPATLTWLADEIGVTIVNASLGEEDGLRLYARIPEPDVVDLAPQSRHRIDVPALEAAYRSRSAVFAHLVPDPDPPIPLDDDSDAEASETTTGADSIGSRS